MTLPDPASQREERSGAINLFGLIIEKRTDILAATAFLLALFGAISQVVAFLRGADVSIYPSDVVVLYFDRYPNNETFVRVAAQVSYVNTGRPGYDAIVRRETVTLHLGDEAYLQEWQSFQRLDRKGTVLEFVREGDVFPVPVTGGSSASHSTVFAPEPVRCSAKDEECDPVIHFLTDEKFLNRAGAQEELVLEFAAEVLGGDPVIRSSCTIDIDKSLLTLIMMNRWYAATCWTPT